MQIQISPEQAGCIKGRGIREKILNKRYEVTYRENARVQSASGIVLYGLQEGVRLRPMEETLDSSSADRDVSASGVDNQATV